VSGRRRLLRKNAGSDGSFEPDLFQRVRSPIAFPLWNPFPDPQRRWQTNRCLWTKPNRVENTVCCRRYRPGLTVNFAPIVPKRWNLTFGTVLSFVGVLMPFPELAQATQGHFLPVGNSMDRVDARRHKAIATDLRTSRRNSWRPRNGRLPASSRAETLRATCLPTNDPI